MKNLDFRYIFFLIVVSFALNILWENLQAPLFTGFVSFSNHFPMCFVGTIGDVVINLTVLTFMILLRQDLVLKFNKSDFIALAILGFIIAVAIEQNALLTSKWGYNSAMIVLPHLHVGLAPILQMVFLLPLSFYLTQKLFVIIKHN